MEANQTFTTSNDNHSASTAVEFPYHSVTLTLCYLVGSLQVGYYMFYILFMGTDSLFKASQAFDYEDFDCQRKAISTGVEDFENNANIGACTRRDTITETETESETGGGGGDCTEDDEDEEVLGRGSRGRRVLVADENQVVVGTGGRTQRSAPATASIGLRGPLHRLMQSCSCMLVYNSDDEEDDEDDSDVDTCDEDEDCSEGDVKVVVGPLADSGAARGATPSSATLATATSDDIAPPGGKASARNRRRVEYGAAAAARKSSACSRRHEQHQ